MNTETFAPSAAGILSFTLKAVNAVPLAAMTLALGGQFELHLSPPLLHYTTERNSVMIFSKATKTKSKLRLALTGTAGAGKTLGSLLIAKGLGGKIALIDTENGSGNLYSDICDYDICNLSAPYDPRKYIQCIHEAEKLNYDIIILDSISHEWNGEGGCLDIHAKETAAGKGNSFTAWGKITPLHNLFVQAFTASTCHIIATIRSKTEHIINDNRQVVKVGLAPVQRDGLEYEFGTVFDISASHLASVSKDRTGIFPDTPFRITPEIGEKLRDWLNDNANTKKAGEALHE